MSVTASVIQSLIDKFVINLGRMDNIVNGPSTGAGSTVTTDSGDVPTLARAVAIANPTHELSTLKLSAFLAEESDPVVALTAAIIALFESNTGPVELDCEGIQLDIESGIIVRPPDVANFGNTRAFRSIRGLNLNAIGSGWADGDYMFSLCGEQGVSNLRYFTLHRPQLRMNGKNLIGIHMSGYYHYSILHPMIREFGDSAIGIYSSRWARSSGVSTLDGPGDGTSFDVSDGADNGNHGAFIYEPDFQGTFGNEDDIVGIYTEDGDFNVTGGWLSWMRTGILTQRGGLNTRGIHFSMGDKIEDTTAVRCNVPRACFLSGDELDGCVYVFDNPTANSFYPGLPHDGYSDIVCEGMKFTSSKPSPSGTNYGAVVNLRTQTEGQTIAGLYVAPHQAKNFTVAANTKNLVRFRTAMTGSWDQANFSGIHIRDPENFGTLPADLPNGTDVSLVRVEDGAGAAGAAFNSESLALELFDEDTTDRPGVKAMGDDLLLVGGRAAGSPVIALMRAADKVFRLGSTAGDGVLELFKSGISNPKVIPVNGNPEGVVSATKGTIALNGGSGAALYVKESGSGTTGWSAK